MLHKHRHLTTIVGAALFAVYSIVMMATAGSAGWAWLILAAAVVLMVTAARQGLPGNGESHDG
ncbi:MAG: hypothetical protein QNJ88_08385 [Acidimicrobiia bacterium]|nr:hypothetical protein [Acidimicrobiia bacterium]